MEIKLENVCYNDILRKVNIDIELGAITAIIGSNGSGKSTLLNILVNKKKPTDGSIIVDGDISAVMVNQFTDDDFFEPSIISEIKNILNKKKFDSDEKINKHILTAIKMSGLTEDIINKDPLKLSTSEMKKLSLAKALSVNPDLLILDEPTIGFDLQDKMNLVKVLKTIKRYYSKTIVIASQDVDFIHLVADNVVAMNNGKVILKGNKYDVFKNIDMLKANDISIPRIIMFENKVLKDKNIKLGYRDEINDLVKDILRNRNWEVE